MIVAMSAAAGVVMILVSMVLTGAVMVPVVVTGFLLGGVAHEFSQVRDFSHGHSASIPKPAA